MSDVHALGASENARLRFRESERSVSSRERALGSFSPELSALRIRNRSSALVGACSGSGSSRKLMITGTSATADQKTACWPDQRRAGGQDHRRPEHELSLVFRLRDCLVTPVLPMPKPYQQLVLTDSPCRRAESLDQVLSPNDLQRTVHELRVRQIELEMRNEELHRAHAEIEAAHARYFDLYDLAPVGYCTLSEQGQIREANLTAASLLGLARGDLTGQPMSRFIVKEYRHVFHS